MIKKLNILLAIVFAAMFAMKGAKSIKESHAKRVAMRVAPVLQADGVSRLAPNVYYGFFAGYTLENPISNRNGILLDMARAIFPNAKFIKLDDDEMPSFIEKLSSDERAVVLGYGDHPLFKDIPRAPTPMAKCPIVLMTQRSNPWRYSGPDSLKNISIVAEDGYLDYKIVRELLEMTERGEANLRIVPPARLREMVFNGEVDAFVTADVPGQDATMSGDLASIRYMNSFRKSKHVGYSDYLFFVSGRNPAFAKELINDYEAGMRRIEASGELRRIREYYGTFSAPEL